MTTFEVAANFNPTTLSALVYSFPPRGKYCWICRNKPMFDWVWKHNGISGSACLKCEIAFWDQNTAQKNCEIFRTKLKEFIEKNPEIGLEL